MKHGSLFSGIGGFDLAAEWMGWENIFHCEWNEFGQKILKHYWSKAISYADITTTDFSIHRGTIDILTGGFPCQPYSSAGKRLGKEDDRHLWPEMLRAIGEISPRYVVGENVRGLTNWNGGLVFDEVQADLEAKGYEVLPFLLPACAVNAPHRRDRIWFIAYSPGYGSNRTSKQTSGEVKRSNRHEAKQSIERSKVRLASDSASKGREEREQIRGQQDTKETGTGMEFWPERFSENGNVTDTLNERFPRQGEQSIGGEKEVAKFSVLQRATTNSNSSTKGSSGKSGETESNRSKDDDEPRSGRAERKQHFGRGELLQHASDSYSIERCERRMHTTECKTSERHISSCNARSHKRSTLDQFPTQSPVCNGDDGLSARLDGITFSKWRNESIKAGGNAIVPQVAHQIFKAIEQYEISTLTPTE